ncbi:MAG TPA: hypothetical protein VJZ27_05240 [Aggregatilineales bacterium]|nr:hypothetical protein [Aggregatilineales bacterium]
MSGLYERVESHLAKKQNKDLASLYERLNQQLDDETTGLTPVDLMSLKGTQKKVMLMLIRDGNAILQGITLEEMKQKLSEVPDDLIESLKVLAENGWLILLGEPPRIRYRVFMKRKRGSTLGPGIWAAITRRLNQQHDD